jgi:hypothetical protein
LIVSGVPGATAGKDVSGTAVPTTDIAEAGLP